MPAQTIEVKGITKSFGSTQALADVDLLAETGKVLGLLGPNGAGGDRAGRAVRNR